VLHIPNDCPLCAPTPHELIWQDNFCRIILLNDADYPGYCRVELLEHVKEMTDVDANSLNQIMSIVFATEQAIRNVLQPTKINLASLGNKTPHIHWHVIPRFENDRHFPNSHWGESLRNHKMEQLSDAQKMQLKSEIVNYLKTAS